MQHFVAHFVRYNSCRPKVTRTHQDTRWRQPEAVVKQEQQGSTNNKTQNQKKYSQQKPKCPVLVFITASFSGPLNVLKYFFLF